MSWLTEHCLARRTEVAQRRALVSEDALRAVIADQAPTRGFLNHLRRTFAHEQRVAVIAEIKFRSPSMGQLRPQIDVEHVATSYEASGATALSVLIDAVHFGGQREYLTRARAATQLPAIAKGFLVDPYDVLEARSYGADAVLLIASCLSRGELEVMHALALELGMDALVELHSEADFHTVEGLALPLVGVNHRDLDTLQMDMGLSERLSQRLPPVSLRVAESGLKTPEDLARMQALGYQAVLVGTAFMQHPEPGEELAMLLGTHESYR